MVDILGVNGQPINRSTENIKGSILGLERFMFVLQNVNVPGRFTKGFHEGFDFLQQMHDQLLAQLTPEEIEAMKAEVNKKPEGVN